MTRIISATPPKPPQRGLLQLGAPVTSRPGRDQDLKPLTVRFYVGVRSLDPLNMGASGNQPVKN